MRARDGGLHFVDDAIDPGDRNFLEVDIIGIAVVWGDAEGFEYREIKLGPKR